jgi:hypothetical protein
MTIACVWVHNSLSNAKLWQSSMFLFPKMQKLFALFSQMQKALASKALCFEEIQQ